MVCRYNLGHHMLPSNKFLLYDHSLRIPMVIMGPGIKPNSANEFLGTQVCEHFNVWVGYTVWRTAPTLRLASRSYIHCELVDNCAKFQVDLAPTMLGFAGINTPTYMDGMSQPPRCLFSLATCLL